jgi:uncharacterized protein (TIGR02246 family)
MRITLGGAMLAVGVGLAGCGQAKPLNEADKAAIRAVADSFTALVRAGNDSGVAALYTENVVMMPPNEGIVEGRAALRAYFATLPPSVEIQLVPIDVDGRGDLAYVRGTYQLTIPAMGGQPAMTDRGKYLEIWRRGGGREWRIAVDISNSDQPAMAASSPPAQVRPNRTPRN